ncbi:hypothetical protein ABZ281_16145 [Streptomyces sp. NPDC006265]|uniref:hypothetical protein n=1 Tax=Streptomyces sp. NPDC006265 TaxID=3156740 RepID=UPI0033BB278E
MVRQSVISVRIPINRTAKKQVNAEVERTGAASFGSVTGPSARVTALAGGLNRTAIHRP